jgi:hypothetical protein
MSHFTWWSLFICILHFDLGTICTALVQDQKSGRPGRRSHLQPSSNPTVLPTITLTPAFDDKPTSRKFGLSTTNNTPPSIPKFGNTKRQSAASKSTSRASASKNMGGSEPKSVEVSNGVVFELAVTQTSCAQGFLTSSRVFDNLGQ